ncbi:MAG: VWA domain-containing protein [Planctomycetes bacterium]|nr:VWA domain-containing protein [Planctomycetota bacterium]
MSTVLLGMVALAVDIGAMYVAQAELQAAADSAALAAAAQLAGDGQNDPETLARLAADEYARLNSVFGTYAGVDMANDVELGKAYFNPYTQRFEFQPGGDAYDAVRVTVRRDSASEGGSLQLGFANIFGHSTKDLHARAAAVLVPRDIAVVIDLSGSMNDDSELRHYQFYDEGGQINLRDCWCALDGPAPSRPYIPGAEWETEYAGDTGPTVGIMSTWGDPVDPDTYDPRTDPGLWYIPKYAACTESEAAVSLATRGYSSKEINALMSGSQDGSYSTQWRNRVGVILGLASWASGMPGGFPGGNGNKIVANNEISWIPYPSYRVNWSWTNYIDYCNNWSNMRDANNYFRYRYGIKTFVNFLLESKACHHQTNILWQTPEQPVQAVKDAVQAMVDVIVALESLDHASLETFATSATHEINLTDNLQSVPDRLYQMQAAHYNTTTNLGGGIQRARTELSSVRARAAAAKIIVVMSDGCPNVNESGTYTYDGDPAVEQYVLDQAQAAADEGIRIYAISVGQGVDRDIMQQIAVIGHGQEFYASGTPEEYTDQLEAIFRTLGGKRPVALIE